MIKNIKKWEEFEKDLIKKSKVEVKKNFKIVNELYRFSKKLGKFKVSLEGIEKDIKYARAINGIRKFNS
ncbi:MAG: hypothetical protein N3D74_03890 [Caldisericia bacterium]|nr:hypothetical protein [Caldisericia bacterium]